MALRPCYYLPLYSAQSIWVSRELAKSLFLQQLNTVSIRFCWKRLRSAAVLCVVNLALSNLHGSDFALPTIPKPNKFQFLPPRTKGMIKTPFPFYHSAPQTLLFIVSIIQQPNQGRPREEASFVERASLR